MTFNELFTKMEMNDKAGIAAIAENYLNEMNKDIFNHQLSYQFLYGFLYGLLGAGFISIGDHQKLLNHLLDLKFKNELQPKEQGIDEKKGESL